MACPALTSNHERNTSKTMLERLAQHSHLTMRGTNLVIYVRKAQHSHLTMRGTHPTPCQKETTLTFTSMIGHNYYHLWKGTALTSDLKSSKMNSTYIHQHDRTQLLSSVKRHNTHIYQHDRTHLLSSMDGLCILDLYILQLVSQSHLLVYVLPFK